MKSRNILIILAVISFLSIITTLNISAETPNNITNNQVDGLQLTAQSYAKNVGVSISEAQNRLKVQDSIPDGLEDQLIANEPQSFGGLWIQHIPEFKIILAAVSNGNELSEKYIPSNLAPYIEIKTVKHSEAQLQIDQKTIDKALRKLGIHFVSCIATTNNRIEIEILKNDQSKVENEITNQTLEIPNSIAISYLDDIGGMDVYLNGGQYIENTASSATNGFNVADSSGNRYATTAGHVGTNQLQYTDENSNVHYLNYVAGYWGASYDFEYSTVTGTITLSNRVRSDLQNDYVTITSAKAYSSQTVGDYCWKYGSTTHYTDGYIYSKYACPPTPPYPQYEYDDDFVMVQNAVGYNPIAAAGDSGAPWVSNTTAYGFHSAHIAYDGYSYAIYMPQDYIVSWGLHVLTSP